ncbi:hypothetical protein GA0074696_2855 [Micromonospora purpureochromogenes]|uniref:Uncharacterized protein n=1 Tax=Micromonospora purpureochromogenes TaxID=47872 RepID=A0A1C4XUH1_9ACTN|nr:hypothetical protein GA0074696_2855 [Micromonospora purpureochromogenes]
MVRGLWVVQPVTRRPLRRSDRSPAGSGSTCGVRVDGDAPPVVLVPPERHHRRTAVRTQRTRRRGGRGLRPGGLLRVSALAEDFSWRAADLRSEMSPHPVSPKIVPLSISVRTQAATPMARPRTAAPGQGAAGESWSPPFTFSPSQPIYLQSRAMRAPTICSRRCCSPTPTPGRSRRPHETAASLASEADWPCSAALAVGPIAPTRPTGVTGSGGQTPRAVGGTSRSIRGRRTRYSQRSFAAPVRFAAVRPVGVYRHVASTSPGCLLGAFVQAGAPDRGWSGGLGDRPVAWAAP